MKHRLYSISERTPKRMVVNRRRDRFLRDFIFTSLFLIIWVGSLLQITTWPPYNHIAERISQLIANPFYWIFMGAAFWIFYIALKNLYLLLTGDQILIDKGEGHILKKHGKTILISELESLQIRKYTDSDNNVDYRLSLIMASGEKIFIDRATDRGGIIELAEEIGDFINKPITFK